MPSRRTTSVGLADTNQDERHEVTSQPLLAPWPCYGEEDVRAVARVLRSNRVNYWTGEEGQAFEREFAAFAGAEHAVAVANGTVALELALRVAGVGRGDDVIVTPRSFIASASCIVNVGARPVFADIDLDSQNVTPQSVEAAWTSRTRAVVCVHLAGWPCEMDPIVRLARERDAVVVEDCAQAHGARYRDRSVGGIGDVAAWSFCQDKIMTTGGEGGMVTTSNRALWEAAWSYKDHGKSWEAVFDRTHPPGFRWVHESIGTNWRLTEVQSALGRLQLRRLAQWSAARKRNADALASACSQFDAIRVPAVPEHVRHAYYRWYAFVRPERLAPGWNRDRVVAEIRAAGVPCFHEGICPEIYREAAFDRTDWRPSRRLPNARQVGETCLTFLVHPTITAEQLALACAAVEDVMGRASR